MANLVSPHGGRLLPLLVAREERKEGLEETKIVSRVRLSSKEAYDFIMLAMGAFSPLDGFLKKQDYESVVVGMRLEKGLLWPIPIILSVSKEKAAEIKEGQRIVLVNSGNDEIMASMLVEEKYSYDKRIEALEIFGMDDARHPGVEKIYEQGDVYLGDL